MATWLLFTFVFIWKEGEAECGIAPGEGAHARGIQQPWQCGAMLHIAARLQQDQQRAGGKYTSGEDGPLGKEAWVPRGRYATARGCGAEAAAACCWAAAAAVWPAHCCSAAWWPPDTLSSSPSWLPGECSSLLPPPPP